VGDGMPAQIDVRLIALLLATALLSSVLTWLSIRYARSRQLLDLPGQRRSHNVPTPRGGGIAIVIAVVVGGCALALRLNDFSEALAFLLPPIVFVALVGWLDDHRGLSARVRFATHCFAAAWACSAPLLLLLFDAVDPPQPLAPTLLVSLVLVLAIVWSINLHNFMDGIDGLLTLQALFVFLASAALQAWRGDAVVIAPLLVCAAACIGFLPFNFPRARVFLGDVGSGVLGFLVAIAVLFSLLTLPALASGLVLCSAFVTDASCTLISRMLRGRRWYSAHREHLYQWLVRLGWSHARVVALYMAWNLLIVLPVVYWMNRMPSTHEISADHGVYPVVAVYAVAIALWWYGKRWCLRHLRERGAYAA
jgi:UDP-N-acetylmuramyl pentapeptide phosphotransferase/UDP-N-acetylglucosamine-1-phosphate transferase